MNILEKIISSGIYLPILGYLLGSIPFSLVVSRLIAGVDIREGGSGHATTTNTIRQVGWVPGALVLLLDISKGFFPTYLAVRGSFPLWVVLPTAALTVVGHCWPIYVGFRGGMGLSPAGGSFLAISFTGGMISLAVLIGLVLLFGHAARGSAMAGLAIPPVLWLLGFRGMIFWTALVVGWILAFRFIREDWNREYKELWLDREE
jgi:glycerol-3-phosphate acyltransferase PlsY